MKKFILHLFAFTVCTSVFYIMFLFIWAFSLPAALKPNIGYKIGTYGHIRSRLSEVKETDEVDILFLGSSHAYRGFDPRIFLTHGYTTFNLGSSGQTPIQTQVLLNRYLDRLNPKLVVFEVYPTMLTLDGVESSLDLIANDKNDIFSIGMSLRINNIKTYNTLIYGFMQDLIGLNKSYIEPVQKGDDTYILGGYVEKEVAYYQPSEFEKREIVINQNQLRSFTEIIEMLRNRNIEIIIAFAPIPKVNYQSFTNKNYFGHLMQRYAKYYDFNELVTLDDSKHFYDSHHLNQEGVEVFNLKLIEILNTKHPIKQ